MTTIETNQRKPPLVYHTRSPSMADRKVCNCRKSQCLKLYCDCFNAGLFCVAGSCRCIDCHNNSVRSTNVKFERWRGRFVTMPAFAAQSHESQRNLAIVGVLERRPGAFQSKVQATGCVKLDAHTLEGSAHRTLAWQRRRAVSSDRVQVQPQSLHQKVLRVLPRRRNLHIRVPLQQLLQLQGLTRARPGSRRGRREPS